MTLTQARNLPPDARILIIKSHAIGDLLLTTPAIRDIRRAYPSARITLLVGKWSAPIVRRNPNIDAFLEIDDRILLDKRGLGLARLLFRLTRERFDAAFIFHPMPMIHLFARLAGIPRRYGLTRPEGSRHLTAGVVEDLSAGRYYAENFQRVAALAGVPAGSPRPEVYCDEEDERRVSALLEEAGIAAGKGFVLVAPGGGRNSKDDVAAKRWPRESFESVLNATRTAHPGLALVMTGSAGDRPETGYLAGRVPGLINLGEKLTLGQLVALARRARVILCNDSAVLHIGAAVGAPVVAPFGPTLRERFLPPESGAHALQASLPCSPCYVGGHFPGCPIDHACMRDITPGQVIEKLESALAAGASFAPPR